MKFNEDSRVKIPAILHLMRLGYQRFLVLRGRLIPMLMNGQVTVR